MISPRLVKGGLVEVDVDSGQPRRVIALQYNPDTLTRNVAVQAAAAAGGDHSQPLRLKGVAVETIKLDAELDATDQLEFPGQNPVAVESGLHPQLAALEELLQPTSAALQANNQLASTGILEVLPLEEPLTLFVWSKYRVVPVRLTDLSIVEDAFDTALNPIRAKVAMTLRVLSVDDFGFDHRGGTLFMGYLNAKEALAAKARLATLPALGVEAV